MEYELILKIPRPMKKTTFNITLYGKKGPEHTSVEGFVDGFLGIHKDAFGYYVITHIPTGRKVHRLKLQKDAKRTVRYINKKYDWDFIDIENHITAPMAFNVRNAIGIIDGLIVEK